MAKLKAGDVAVYHTRFKGDNHHGLVVGKSYKIYKNEHDVLCIQEDEEKFYEMALQNSSQSFADTRFFYFWRPITPDDCVFPFEYSMERTG